MMACWLIDSEQRPSFQQISTALKRILTENESIKWKNHTGALLWLLFFLYVVLIILYFTINKTSNLFIS
jgi:hypothetical protein